MNLNQYQQFASRTLPERATNHFFQGPTVEHFPLSEIDAKWALYERNVDLLHAALGLSGEIGELCDPIKRAMFYGKPLGPAEIANIKEEAGDILWYLAGPLCRALGCTLEELATQNKDKLVARYPGKYTDAAALERADKLVRSDDDKPFGTARD